MFDTQTVETLKTNTQARMRGEQGNRFLNK